MQATAKSCNTLPMTDLDVALGVGKVGYIQDGLRNMVLPPAIYTYVSACIRIYTYTYVHRRIHDDRLGRGSRHRESGVHPGWPPQHGASSYINQRCFVSVTGVEPYALGAIGAI